METTLTMLDWAWSNRFELLVWFILVKYWKHIYLELIFSPLSGGNHKVRMDEAAKGVILMVFVASACSDMFRKTEYRVFSDGYYLSLLGVVALIAGIKHGVELFRKTDPTNKSTSESN